MANDTIRIGIIGAGQNTRDKHIPGLREQPDVEIVGVVNSSPESSRRAAEALDIPKSYDSWIDAIADPDTDAIVIGTWPYLHARATIAALEAGKHVMVEARMARDANEAHAMLAAAQAFPKQVAQIVPSPFSLKADRTIQKRLADGYLGDPLAVEVVARSGFIDRDAPLTWRQDYDLSGMNIMSLGIWYEAVMRWLGTATSVMAMGKTFVKMRPSEDSGDDGVLRAVRISDHIDVLGEMACGAQLHIQVSAVAGPGEPPSATLFGSEGTLKFTQNTLFGAQRGDDELSEVEISSELEGGWRVEEEFVNAIRGEEEITHTDFETGVKYMEFTEAVNRSLAAGMSVSLPL